MDETKHVVEMEPIVITEADISEQNQLSLHCPICAGTVEAYPEHVELTPVFCTHCDTLYHQVCWDQNGGHCAVLGCDHEECRLYNQPTERILVIRDQDLNQPSISQVQERVNRALKREAKRNDSWWQQLLERLIRFMKI